MGEHVTHSLKVVLLGNFWIAAASGDDKPQHDAEKKGALETMKPIICRPEKCEDERQLFTFMTAFEEAVLAYRELIFSGANRDARELAHNKDYLRLLKAGQRIRWIGGNLAVSKAAYVIGHLVADGSPADFEQLWSGLLEPANGGNTLFLSSVSKTIPGRVQ